MSKRRELLRYGPARALDTRKQRETDAEPPPFPPTRRRPPPGATASKSPPLLQHHQLRGDDTSKLAQALPAPALHPPQSTAQHPGDLADAAHRRRGPLMHAHGSCATKYRRRASRAVSAVGAGLRHRAGEPPSIRPPPPLILAPSPPFFPHSHNHNKYKRYLAKHTIAKGTQAHKTGQAKTRATMAGGAVSGSGGARAAEYKGGFNAYVLLVALIGGSAGSLFGIDNGESRARLREGEGGARDSLFVLAAASSPAPPAVAPCGSCHRHFPKKEQ